MVRAQWTEMVAQHDRWEARNFPESNYIDSLTGVIEETGELAHAHLKLKQRIRTDEDHEAEGQDAIGDMMIYLMGVMSHAKFVPGQTHTGPKPFVEQDQLLHKIGIAVGKLLLAPEHGHNISALVDATERYCASKGWDFDAIVTETWKKVSKRDWLRDAVKGGENVEVE